MDMTITRVQSQIPPAAPLKNVAGYARVSTGKDAMLNSLSAQISYYSSYIQQHPGWAYAGVFVDEALTGTKRDRAGFDELLEKCRAKQIDMVITKSISRFARNTVTLLETVRELKALGIDVFFEKENLHSIGGDGELLLTILASYAQAESLSVSENCKWRIRKRFEEGKPWAIAALGYELVDGVLRVVPEEAKVVRLIFRSYLEGMGRTAIAKMLNEQGFPNRCGQQWRPNLVDSVLRSEKYVGDMLLQKYYTDDHLNKKTLVNRGQLPMAYVQNAHEPIIDRQTFECVQQEIARRAGAFHPKHQEYPFTGMIVCGGCGKHYKRKCAHGKTSWVCSTYAQKGKQTCPSKQIAEDTLMVLAADVLGLPEFDATAFRDQLISVIALADNRLEFHFVGGTVVQRAWHDRSRSESWDEGMREQARKRKQQYWDRRDAHEPDADF